MLWLYLNTDKLWLFLRQETTVVMDSDSSDDKNNRDEESIEDRPNSNKKSAAIEFDEGVSYPETKIGTLAPVGTLKPKSGKLQPSVT